MERVWLHTDSMARHAMSREWRDTREVHDGAKQALVVVGLTVATVCVVPRIPQIKSFPYTMHIAAYGVAGFPHSQLLLRAM